MSLLWVQAMAWHDMGGPGSMSAEEAQAKPVKKAGFKGYVGPSREQEDEMGEMGLGSRPPGQEHHEFDEDLHEATRPEPTKEEQAHADADKYGDLPDSFYERHDQAYAKAMEDRKKESEPDHRNEGLHDFIRDHGDNQSLWQTKGKLKSVDLSKGVYATQSHVGQKHIDRYLDDPSSMSWHQQSYGAPSGGYLGHDHPMFVKHKGRLHAIEGHHRVGAALQNGDSRIHGWYYDADKHGFPPPEDD